MDNAAINQRLLRAQMALRGVRPRDLAEAQGWSETTLYRKLSGKTAFTAPEIQTCAELLTLDTATANSIFFAGQIA
jgi:hypothetical protein